MHMVMEHRLTRRFLIILKYIESITVQCFLHSCNHLLRKNDRLSCRLLRNLIQIRIMLLRQDQSMSLCCRTKIQNYTELFILIQGSRWNLSICNLTKNTITVFHNNYLLSLYLRFVSVSSILQFYDISITS